VSTRTRRPPDRSGGLLVRWSVREVETRVAEGISLGGIGGKRSIERRIQRQDRLEGRGCARRRDTVVRLSDVELVPGGSGEGAVVAEELPVRGVCFARMKAPRLSVRKLALNAVTPASEGLSDGLAKTAERKVKLGDAEGTLVNSQ